jgi:hypothetical protein
MKIIALITTGMLATATLATAAPAQEHVVRQERTVETHRTSTVRHGNGWNNQHVRRVCHVVYRHHQRIRQCRTVRY